MIDVTVQGKPGVLQAEHELVFHVARPREADDPSHPWRTADTYLTIGKTAAARCTRRTC